MERVFLNPKEIKREDLVFYKQILSPNSHRCIYGVKSDREGYIHVYVDLNQYKQEATPLPPNCEPDDDPSETWIKQFCWNPDARFVEPMRVPEYDQTHYFTHDNGGRPFVVYISDSKVLTVYKKPGYDEDLYVRDEDYANREMYQKKVYQTSFSNLFIGKSPQDDMSEWGQGYGSQFDGNSILAHIDDLKYVFIGDCVKEFTALSPIVFYQSSVGNNDVPYPHAVDKNGGIYLMLDDVIMYGTQLRGRHPYHHYYDICAMITQNKSYKNYKGFYIGEDSFNLTWYANSSANYDRIQMDDDGESVPMFLVKQNDEVVPLTKKSFIEMMQNFASENNLVAYNVKMISGRDMFA